MQRRRELTAFERGMVVGARRMGHSISEVVQEFGFPRSTVSRVYREWVNEGVTVHNRHHTGRPQALNDRDRRNLRRVVIRDRGANVQRITAEFNTGRDRDVSQWTVRRNMRVLGYGSRRPTRVPLLTRRHRTIRRAFANNHHGWTLQQWRNVIWSDESRFQLFHADGRHRVWRTPHEAMDPACQVGTVQAGGLSVMVWGAFSWHGMGPLVVLDATLTGQRYRQLLGDHLHPFVMFQHPDDIAVYQDDNAAPHRANIVRAWFDEHAGEIQRLNWPPRSPDMNPIEHIWDALEVRLRALNPQPTNRTQLAATLQDVWCQLPPDVFQGLADSLPRRIAALRRARGGPTRY